MMKPNANAPRSLTLFIAAAAIHVAALPLISAQEKAAAAATKPAAAAADEPAVDPRARAILRRAIEHLTNAKQFSTTVEVWQDIVDDEGTKLQFTKLVDVRLRRPDRLRLDVRTATPKRSFYFNGSSLTFHDLQKDFYASIEAPKTIDAMIDLAEEKFGIDFPLVDILVSKPFGNGAEAAKTGRYLGLDPVLGKDCHHLAFTSEEISWQVWIEDGSVPVLRKAVITFEQEEALPQYTAIFTEWDMSTALPDYVFNHEPPAGALEIKFETVEEEPVAVEPEAGEVSEEAK